MSDPISNPVDYVILGGQRSPGLAEISDASSPRRWDERKGYGLSGSTVVFRGIGLAKPILTLRLYSAEDFAAWESWRPLVARPPLGSRPRALDIWHPFLEEAGIGSVVVEDVSQPVQSGDGEWTITIKLIEYRRPKLTLARPDGSDTRLTDPIDIEIAANDAEIRRLNAELAR